MTYPSNEEWRHRLLSRLFEKANTAVWKHDRGNGLFFCQHIHSEGVGLVEIHTRNFSAAGWVAFQISLCGQVLGMVGIRPDGRQRLLFDRGEGIGDEVWAEEQALELLRRLAPSVLRGDHHEPGGV